MRLQRRPPETDALKSLYTLDDPDTMESKPVLDNGEACGMSIGK